MTQIDSTGVVTIYQVLSKGYMRYFVPYNEVHFVRKLRR